MRLIVISDTHGRRDALCRIVEKHCSDADHFFFLGDGERELESVCAQFPRLSFFAVSGNNDFSSIAPGSGIFDAGAHRIFYTHGHQLRVKSTLEPLRQSAQKNHCDIALFGHTHHAVTSYADGLYLMNPGSPARPVNSPAGYGVIDIIPSGVALHLVPMQKVPL